MISQNDPQWKLKRINETTSTLGNYGCLITDICFILQKAGYQVTPDQLATQSQLFEGDLWKGWQTLCTLYPKLSYAWGETCTSTPAPIDKIIRELDEGYFPIIMLDYNPTTKNVDTHYLVVLAHDDKKNLKVGDPWDGAEVWLDARYGTQDESIKILKVDVYHFEKSANDPSAWDRIKQFLEEQKADEGKVRAAFGALTDLSSRDRTIADLQDALKNKQDTIANKDQIISDLNNTLLGKNTTISSYADFLQKCAEMLNCKADITEVLGQIRIAVDNEDKYNGCIVEKQQLLDQQDKTIESKVKELSVQWDKEKKLLNETVKDLTTQLNQKETLIKKLTAKLAKFNVNIEAKSILSKIRKLLSFKKV